MMPAWSKSTVLHLIDSIAIAIAQGYMLARVRLISHPSPVVRLIHERIPETTKRTIGGHHQSTLLQPAPWAERSESPRSWYVWKDRGSCRNAD